MHTSDQRKEVRQQFCQHLRQRGLRRTRERLTVLDELYKTEGHTDVETLYFRLNQKGHSISRATVYNTLNLLMDCDLAVRHQFGTQSAKYEPSFRYWQHDHLICLDCHEVLEFCDPRIQRIQDMVAEVYHFDIKRHALNLYGHCRNSNCIRRSASQSEGNPIPT